MMRNSISFLAVMTLMLSCMPIPSIDDEPTGGGNNTGNEGVEAVYPIARYLFNGSADDEFGNYNGILNGNPEFIDDTPDGSASALKLNAFKEQFVNIPYDFLNGLEQYSFSAWIKDFSQGMIFSAEGENDIPYLNVTDAQGFLLYNDYYTYVRASEYTFSYDCTSIMSSQWHHLAVTSYKGEICLYINGRKVDSLSPAYDNTSCTKLYIGGNGDGRLANYMSMKIDNVMFFDYCLTSAEVDFIYQYKL